MRVEKFEAERSEKISKLILEKYSFCSYSGIMKCFRNKDVKVNGARVNKDFAINIGDEVQFYYDDSKSEDIEIIFEDKNICVIFKPRKLETVSETASDDARTRLSKKLKMPCFAVHRLDRNTTGLVVFAKNANAKKSLDEAFKNRTIEKFYIAAVCGEINKKGEDLFAYLKKDEKKSIVSIRSVKLEGYEPIETKYKLIERKENLSIVEVELVTGKTHQIRAHFSFIGHPVIGDEKYGNSKINSLYKMKYQCLCSYKIKFHFDEDNYLGYLNGKTIELEKDKIDFLKVL